MNYYSINRKLGFIAGAGSSYTLPIATTTKLGGVKPDGVATTVNEWHNP